VELGPDRRPALRAHGGLQRLRLLPGVLGAGVRRFERLAPARAPRVTPLLGQSLRARRALGPC
jgi:hypothetical protein